MFQIFLNNTIEHLIHLAVVHIDFKELWVTYNILYLAGRENLISSKLMSSIKEKKILISKLKQNIEELDEGIIIIIIIVAIVVDMM